MHIRRLTLMVHFNHTIDFVHNELNCFSAHFFAAINFSGSCIALLSVASSPLAVSNERKFEW